jgi:hypothetical protein
MTPSLAIGHLSIFRHVCCHSIFWFTINDPSLFLSGATLIILSSQITFLFNFFLSRNLRIAHEHAWGQTIASRGKGPSFWQPYVEEWDLPPTVDISQWVGLEKVKSKLLRFTMKNCELAHSFKIPSGIDLKTIVILIPLHVVPVGGLFVTAAFKALDTAHHLHKPVCAFALAVISFIYIHLQYFKLKNMTKEQIAIFIAEHKWDYQCEFC